VGKLLYEFRKASNDFKFQIEEELRASEQAERQKELSAQAAASQPATPVAITAGETVSAKPATDEAQAAEPAGSDTATAETEVPEAPNSEIATPDTSTPETPRTPTIQPPASGLPVSSWSPYRAVDNAAGGIEVTAARQSLDEPQALDEPRAQDEPQALDELQADSQEAMRAAAAEPSHSQTGDSVPTHHG
jgi:sec-independent protein translocase protein TatB